MCEHSGMTMQPDFYFAVWNKDSGLSQQNTQIESGLSELSTFREIKKIEVADIVDSAALKAAYDLTSCKGIIAIGGDGTVSACAGTAAELGIKMMVIPAGTFNHFAVHSNIPRDIPEAFALLQSGEPQYIDLGSVNGRNFINFACLGFYSDIIQSRIQLQKNGGMKWTSFFWAVTKQTFSTEKLEIVVSTESGDTFTKRTPLLFIGNGQFQFGSADLLAGRKSFVSQKLQVLMLKDYSRPRLLLLALASMLFDTTKWLSIEDFSLTKFSVKLPEQKKVSLVIDGELVKLTGTLRFAAKPLVLRVVLPKHAK